MKPMFDDLYNIDILTLSASLRHERLDSPHASVRKLSRLCGSWLEIDLCVKSDNVVEHVSECAVRVQACALGQASAAILKAAIIGASRAELFEAQRALTAMLKAAGTAPKGRFEKLALLQGVKDYPARHTSTLLAFDAALEAMDAALAHV